MIKRRKKLETETTNSVDEDTTKNKPHIIYMWVSVKIGSNAASPHF